MNKDDIYKKVLECYGYRCIECGTDNNVEIHHKLVNSKVNRRRFPLFLSSPMNLIILCGGFEHNCHENYKHLYKIREREATLYETFLQELKNE